VGHRRDRGVPEAQRIGCPQEDGLLARFPESDSAAVNEDGARQALYRAREIIEWAARY
jgi:hypothetical protein